MALKSTKYSGLTLLSFLFVHEEEISSLEAMARIYDYAALMEYYVRREDEMVSDMAAILSGMPDGEVQAGDTDLHVCFNAFGSDGFGEFTDNSNQVRHFTAGFDFGYRDPFISRSINLIRPDEPADEGLNTESTRIGRSLRRGDIQRQDLGDEIRRIGGGR